MTDDSLKRYGEMRDDPNEIAACSDRWKRVAAIIGCELHGFDDDFGASFVTPDRRIIAVGPEVRAAIVALGAAKASSDARVYSAEATNLRAAIETALCCTPRIGQKYVGIAGLTYRPVIEYDRGDPWAILREALAKNPADSPVPDAAEVETLIERLDATADSASRASQMLAEAKSLRQTDNPEGRKDLYAYLRPEQTVEGQAAAMLRRFLGQRDCLHRD